MTPSSLVTIQSFLDHAFSGRMEEALSLVDAEAHFIATRPTASESMPVYGTHLGPEGAKKFLELFGAMLIPGTFEITAAFSEGEHAALYGSLHHTSRATGRAFVSDWALIARVRNGKLMLYHFYEDTAALEHAVLS